MSGHGPICGIVFLYARQTLPWYRTLNEACRNYATYTPPTCPVSKLPHTCPVNIYVSEHPETGGVGIELEYEDGVKLFTPEQIVACMLSKVG